MNKVAIIGAGIGGLATAINLAKNKYNIDLYDRSDPLEYNTSSGLSFNYTINLRGMNALMILGLWDKVKLLATPLLGRTIHSGNSKVSQSYSPDGSFFLYSIPRNELIKILYFEVASLKNVTVHLNREVTEISFNNDLCYVNVTNICNNSNKMHTANFIVATDGVKSRTRSFLSNELYWVLETFPWVYNEFKLSSLEVKKCQLDPNNINIWPLKNALCVGIPNQDRSISVLYCYCAASHPDTILNIKENFRNLFGSVESINTIKLDKVGKLNAVKLDKWFVQDKIVFLGDAAHGIFPFYGQGMNSALEDSKCLGEMLNKFPANREQAFKDYYGVRKVQTDILFELSNKHFDVLKNKGQTVFYNAKHRLDLMLHHYFPKLWYHEYTMMSFSLIDIRRIYRRLNIQKYISLLPLYWIGFLVMMIHEIKTRTAPTGKLNKMELDG